MLARTVENYSSNKVVGSIGGKSGNSAAPDNGVARLASMAGVAALATAGVVRLACMVGASRLAMAGVTMLITAGFTGLPRHTGTNIDQSRQCCCWNAQPPCASQSRIRPLMDVVTHLDCCGARAPGML